MSRHGQGSYSLIFIALTALLLSCTTIKKEDCKSVNWQRLGHKDGLVGDYQESLETYGFACQDYGIKPDNKAYKAGYKKGLKKFCTYKNGYNFGKAGSYYDDQCSKLGDAVETEFMKGYTAGRGERKMDQLRTEIEDSKASGLGTVMAGKQCSFDSDCTIELECEFGTCKNTARSCSFDSDCEIEGDCSFGKCEFN